MNDKLKQAEELIEQFEDAVTASSVAFATDRQSSAEEYEKLATIKKSDIKLIISNLIEENERYISALKAVVEWNLPEASLRDGTKCSYGIAYGSNGERDYIRKMAQSAIRETILNELTALSQEMGDYE